MSKFLLITGTILLVIFTLWAIISKNESPEKTVSVAAASDLKFALDSIVSVYHKEHPNEKVQVNYGSSGKFFEQIQNNAPFDIYFSADISYPQKLKDKRLTTSDVKTYGIGRLVIWSKNVDPNIKKVESLLDPRIKKIAIANPEHAPYGARAKETLKHFQIYESLKNKLVYGENISQAAQFITSGAADIGIVALSLALSPNMKNEGGSYYIIPENAHVPLEQGYVILKNSEENESTENFYKFIASPTAINILSHFGFTQK